MIRTPRTVPVAVAVAAAAALAALALAAGAASAAVQFEDAADDAGIDFVHTGGGHFPWFPEMMGSGACFVDADADGYEDVFIVNGAFRDADLQARERPHGRLYVNAGDGTFRDATDGSGLDVLGFGNACSVADWNGDGCQDLYLSGYDLSHLFRSRCDATFEDVTAASGVTNDACDADEGIYPCFAHSSAWADYDRDGDLDLFVANYVELNQTVITHNSPMPYAGQRDALYRNNGDGTFTDVAAAAGVLGEESLEGGKSLGVAWQDWNLDGWVDFYVAQDEVPDYLYENNGDGTFTNVGPEHGVSYSLAGMGVAWGDWDNNGCPDFIVTHYIGELDGFARNYCTHLADESGDQHGMNQTYWDVRWGVAFVDYDNDGWKDVVIVSGHVYYDPLNAIHPDMAPTAYHNELGDPNRTVTFSNANTTLGPDFQNRSNARGAAFGDYDFDGGIDVVVVNNHNESARLLKSSGQTNNWIEIRLRDPATPMNRDAIGARVNITVGDGFQIQQMHPGHSFESSNSHYLHYGLGDADTVESVRVTWPDGAEDVVTGLAANGVYRITRGGAVTNDTLSPTTTIVPRGDVSPDGAWRIRDAGFTVESADRGVTHATGVVETWYRIDDGPATRYETAVDLPDGEHTVRAWSVDAAGNRSPDAVAVIRVDSAPPITLATLTGAPAASGWHLTRPTLTLEATDATSGVDRIEIRDGDAPFGGYSGPFAVVDGEHAFEYRAVDAAGHVEAAGAIIVRVDTAPPAVDVSVEATPGDSAWWRSNATVSLAASDAASGLDAFTWRLDGATESPYTVPIAVEGDGVHRLEYRATDAAGNGDEWIPYEVKVDATAPTSSATFAEEPATAPWMRRVTLTLAGDDATSGLEGLYYRVDGGDAVRVDGPIDLPEGDVTVDWFARDAAGNEEAASAAEYLIDATPPTTAADVAGDAGDNGWWRSPLQINVTATDAASGVATTRVALDDDAPAPHDGTPVHVTAQGATTLRYASDDAAGNAEPERALTLHVDSAPPTLVLHVDGAEGTGGWMADAAPRYEAADATSGLAHVTFEIDGEAATPGAPLAEGVHQIRLAARDVAGNDAATIERTVRVDGTPPTTALRVASGGHHDSGGLLYVSPETLLALDASDNGSGVAATYYRLDDGDAVTYDGPLTLTHPGPRAITYWSVDRVGHESAPTTRRLHVDAAAPDVANVTPASGDVRAADLTLTLPDADASRDRAILVGNRLTVRADVADNESGVALIEIIVDGDVRATYTTSGHVEWSTPLALANAGEHTVTVRAVDRVGNEASVTRVIHVVPVPWALLHFPP